MEGLIMSLESGVKEIGMCGWGTTTGRDVRRGGGSRSGYRWWERRGGSGLWQNHLN
jgi:hypothetical protein